MSDVRYSVSVSSEGAVTAIQKLDAAWDKLGTTGKATPNIFSTVSSSFKSMMSGFIAGQFIVDGIRKTFGFLKDAVVDGVKGAMEAEASQTALAAALDMTGRRSESALANMQKFAMAQMQATIYTHEQVESVMTLLVQMTKLDSQGIQRATTGVIGLASVMKMDLDSAARMVMKAMEGNYAALSRVGIKVEETLSPMQKQASLLDQLTAKYGRATAEAGTFGGRMTQLKNAFDEMKEGVGDVIVKNERLSELLGTLKVMMDQFSGATSKSSGPLGAMGAAITVIADQIQQRLGPLLAVLALEQAKANAEANKIQEAYDRGQALWEKMGWTAKTLAAGVDVLNEEQTKLLVTQKALFSDDTKTKIEAAQKALELYVASGRSTPEGVKNMETYINGLKKSLEALNPVLAQAAQSMAAFGRDVSNPSVNNAFQTMADNAKTLGAVFGGALGKVIDYTEKVPGLFEGLCAGTTTALKTTEEQMKVMDALSAQMFGDMINGFTSIMDGSVAMGDLFSKIAATMIADLGKMVIAELMFGKASIMAAQMQAVAHAIASIFKTLPWFIALPVAAGAFALVSKLFSKLLKFEQGGVFTKPTIAEVGHGTEYVLPERKLINLVRDAMRMPAYGAAPAMALAGGGRGGGVIVNFNGPLISTTGLSDADIRMAGSRMKDEVVYQMRRLGR